MTAATTVADAVTISPGAMTALVIAHVEMGASTAVAPGTTPVTAPPRARMTQMPTRAGTAPVGVTEDVDEAEDVDEDVGVAVIVDVSAATLVTPAATTVRDECTTWRPRPHQWRSQLTPGQ